MEQQRVVFTPVVLLRATASWAALDNDRRIQWLESKRAKLAEFQMQPNGVIWVDGRSNSADDMIMMLWQLVDADAARALIDVLNDPDVAEYFYATIHGGQPATDQEAIWRPFLRG